MPPSSTTVRSLEQLIQFETERRGSTGKVMWYRGHEDATWQLKPSVYRRLAGREDTIRAKFAVKSSAVHPDCPGPEQLMPFLCFMQHHGLPTRLLDWSGSVAVAAFFAVWYETIRRFLMCPDAKQQNQTVAVWALNPAALNKAQGWSESLYLHSSEVATRLARLDCCCNGRSQSVAAVTAPRTDRRMFMQLAEYTIHGCDTALEDLPESEAFLHLYLLPPESLNSIRMSLSTIGITMDTLFPDVDHLADSIRFDELTLWHQRRLDARE